MISLVHALTCIFIVIFILLQDPKGGVLGSLGGGAASRSLFGGGGASDFLVKGTKWLAIIFACTSFYLTFMSVQKDSRLMAEPAAETGAGSAADEAAAPSSAKAEPSADPPAAETPPAESSKAE